VLPFTDIMVDASVGKTGSLRYRVAMEENRGWGEPVVSLLGCKSHRQPGQERISKMLAGEDVELGGRVVIVRDPHPVHHHHAASGNPPDCTHWWQHAKFVHHKN
jgi:hypothetical protein